MPSARTYQAIGYATYHGGKVYARRHRAELQRRALVPGLVVAGVALAAAAAAVTAAARSRRPALAMH
jgi:hypothetical protein